MTLWLFSIFKIIVKDLDCYGVLLSTRKHVLSRKSRLHNFNSNATPKLNNSRNHAPKFQPECRTSKMILIWMLLLLRIQWCSIQTTPIPKAKDLLRIYPSRRKTACLGIWRLSHPAIPGWLKFRVEKYRPDTLDDVSGHQDILATINRFVDTNVQASRYLSSDRSN